VRRHTLVAGFGAVALLVSLASAGEAQVQPPSDPVIQPEQEQEYQQYTVVGAQTPRQRTQVSRTGAAIDEVRPEMLVVTATADEAQAIERLGYEIEALPTVVGPLDHLPPGYENYHDFADLNQAIDQVVADHPNIAQRQVLGQSYQGRNLIAVKISDNVAAEEGEPEVLFTHSQHAREILTVEMAVDLLDLFTDGYGSNSQITQLVNTRVIWIVANANPDGSEYDKTPTGFRSWRKNRQPNAGTSAVGTDTNRNWDYNWGCCGGSSGSPSSSTYRGTAAESAPEVEVLADFVRSRVIGGQQRITAHIDWHAYGELILWPYGYTFANTAPGLDATDQAAFASLGEAMAQTNGYTPQQSSDLYITDGSIGDWMWGVHRIFSYTFEVFPQSSNPGFYPQDSVIAQETSRNRAAALLLTEYADCPYRIINVSCGAPPTTVFSDDFESATGWSTNPNGTDTAATGQWQRANPQTTSYSGTTLQLGTTTSGLNDLVTGAAAGSNAGVNDIDGGVTSIQSPAITLPSTGTLSLSARWYLAHLNNATSADFFRIRVVSGTSTTTVFQQLGAASNRPGSWGTATANLTQFAGQTVRILVEAADAGGGSLVEAGVDDVSINRQT
jgi:carboxypeptidase T